MLRREKHKPNLFVKVYVDQQPPYKTRTQKETLKATWKDPFTISSAEKTSRLLIKLKHKSFLPFHTCFGTVTITVEDLLQRCEGGKPTQLRLQHGPKKASSDANGSISVCIKAATIAEALDNDLHTGEEAVERLQPKKRGAGRETVPFAPAPLPHPPAAGSSAAGDSTSRTAQKAAKHPEADDAGSAAPERPEAHHTGQNDSLSESRGPTSELRPSNTTSRENAQEISPHAMPDDPHRHHVGLTSSLAAISPKVDTLVSNISQNADVFDSLGIVLEKVKLIADVTANAMDTLAKAYKKQEDTDTAVIGLFDEMKDLYSFVSDVQSLPDKIRQLETPIVAILKQTTECVIFFREYSGRGFVARLVGQAVSDRSKTISDLSSKLKDLRHNLESRLDLYTAFVSTQTREGVDKLVKSDNLEKLVRAKMIVGDRPTCLSGTRQDVLDDILERLMNPSDENIIWLHGAAGLGKSTIATTIAEHFAGLQRRGAFMIFDRNSKEESQPSRVISTLAYQLAKCNEAVGSAVSAAIDRDPLLCETAILKSQLTSLLSRPLSEVSTQIEGPIVIILDALDECGSADSRITLLQLLSSPEFSKLPRQFRFLITSRPERDIKNAFHLGKHIHPVDLSMASSADLCQYIRSKTQSIYQLSHSTAELDPGWPSEIDIHRLVALAAGLFIWAATAVRLLMAADDPADCLQSLLAQKQTDLNLHELYKTVLFSACGSDGKSDIYKHIFGIMIVSQVPLTAETMADLLEIGDSGKSYRIALQRLGSVMKWSPGQPARMLHKSFPDYLTDRVACGAEPWFIDIKEHHHALTVGCLRIMNSQLRFNICNLKSSHIPNVNITDLAARIEAAIPQNLAYACRFLRHHLHLIPPGESTILSLMLQFFESKFLFWLEVLSLMGEIQVASQTIIAVKNWVPSTATRLQALANDALKFVRVFAAAMTYSTPHIYISCIPLSPPSSVIKQQYLPSLKNTLVISVNMDYGWAALQLLYTGHTDKVTSAAFSPNGKHIASGSEDGTVHIWDAETSLLAAGPIRGHTGPVKSVSFSPDGHKVASGSDDRTVCIWDGETGALAAGPFLGHTGYVLSVAFSSDGRKVASGSGDRSVRIWDTEAGVLTARPFKGHSSWVRSVAFSSDGLKIASGSDDRTIRIWNVEIGTLVAGPFTGHTSYVRSVVFSPDGRHVASGSDDRTVCIWGVEAGNLIAGPFEGHTGGVMSVAYAPDGSRVASGSDDQTVRIWDLKSGTVTRTFKGHTRYINLVAFSSDGQRIASASDDGTARIWDAEPGPLVTDTSKPFKGHTQYIRSMAFSPDGRQIVSGSEDGTVCIWDTETGGLAVGPLEGHTGIVYSVAYSPDGRQVASGSADKTARIWNVEKGSHTALRGHIGDINSVAFSPDGQKVASGSDDKTVRIWDVANGTLTAGPFKGHTERVLSVVFSPDGRRVASGSRDKSVRIWDVEAGVLAAGPFKEHTDAVESVAFSPDGRKIASGSVDQTIRIFDVNAGSCVVIKGHTGNVCSVAFSSDGWHIASGSEDDTLRIWDAETGALIVGPFERQRDTICSVSFSPDGRRLAYAGLTIHIFDVSTLIALPKQAESPSSHPQEPGGNEVRVSDGFTQSSRLLASGWMTNRAGDLLFYIPPELRAGLWWPDDTTVITTASTRATKLDASRFVHGEDWARSHTEEPNTVHTTSYR
ncbi:hypothetical protein HWV62_13223 [Athelia sp. TMB]|nr:hypothetical protein HWV62_13223 [Athelia sp. TMB]